MRDFLLNLARRSAGPAPSASTEPLVMPAPDPDGAVGNSLDQWAFGARAGSGTGEGDDRLEEAPPPEGSEAGRATTPDVSSPVTSAERRPSGRRTDWAGRGPMVLAAAQEPPLEPRRIVLRPAAERTGPIPPSPDEPLANDGF